MATTRVAQVGWSTGLKLIMDQTTTFNLLATNGEVKDGRQPVYVNMADIGDLPGKTTPNNPNPENWWVDPFNNSTDDANDPRIKVITADGNASREVTVAFDCDNTTLPTLLDWFVTKRKESFTLVMGTTDLRYVSLPECVWSSFALTGTASGLVTGSLTAPTTTVAALSELYWSGADEFFESTQYRSSPPVPTYPSFDLVPYWQTGNTDVITWTINLTQMVEPKYLNNGSDGPLYFRIGPWEAIVTFETLVNMHDPQDETAARSVRVCASRLFQPLTGLRLDKTITKGGHNESVRYSYSFTCHGEPTSYTDDAVKSEAFEVV